MTFHDLCENIYGRCLGRFWLFVKLYNFDYSVKLYNFYSPHCSSWTLTFAKYHKHVSYLVNSNVHYLCHLDLRLKLMIKLIRYTSTIASVLLLTLRASIWMHSRFFFGGVRLAHFFLLFFFVCCHIMCLNVPSPVLWCPLRFPQKTMFVSSLPPAVCRRAHVLFTLFVFVCV